MPVIPLHQYQVMLEESRARALEQGRNIEREMFGTFPNHEREVQDEGRNESDGTEGGPDGTVGHGCTGDSGYGECSICGATTERPRGVHYGGRDAQIGPVRPEGGEDCDDPATFRGLSDIITQEPSLGWVYWGNTYWGPPLEVRRREEAYGRAEALLLEHLDEGQTRCWKDTKVFDVIAPSGNEYTLKGGGVSNYKENVWYCLQPDGCEVPSPDVALAHKLWLEADEEGFLRTANCFPLRLEHNERLSWQPGMFYDILFGSTNATANTIAEDAPCP